MASFRITIDSILGGIAPNLFKGGPGQFAADLNIDPDLSMTGVSTDVKTPGILRPSSYGNIAGGLLTSYPLWFLTNPKNELFYAYLRNGLLLSYNSTFGAETNISGATFTVTIASPAVFTATAHGYLAGDIIQLTTTGALPTGLVVSTDYYVISTGLTANAFQVSATLGGSAINTSGTQSGTHSFLFGAGNGAAYYNNYLYLATPTNIARYGPLSETPSAAHAAWTTSALGTQTTLLGNPTFPTQRNVLLPNHPMHVHVDGKLYVGDFSMAAEANRGRGLIHWIRTTRGTDEGDTNDGTTRTAFALPFGYAPTDIESWGTDLVISAIYIGGANTAGTSIGANNTLVSGKAALFFWDAVNTPSLPYRMIPLVDPLCTALLNHNGTLYIWSGNINNGVRLSIYEGGYKTKQIAFFEEGFSPPAGAVEGLGNKVVWGAFTTYPEYSASVYALGYKDANLPLALHNIMNSGASATASAGMITAIKYAQHASFVDPRFVVGWRDASNFGIDRLGTTARVALWRSLYYAVGRPFRINKLTIPLGAAIGANMTIVPTIRVDDDSATTTLTTINNTFFTASERRIVLYPEVYGFNNFNLQLRWSGTAILPVTLPIVIEGETLEDATG